MYKIGYWITNSMVRFEIWNLKSSAIVNHKFAIRWYLNESSIQTIFQFSTPASLITADIVDAAYKRVRAWRGTVYSDMQCFIGRGYACYRCATMLRALCRWVIVVGVEFIMKHDRKFEWRFFFNHCGWVSFVVSPVWSTFVRRFLLFFCPLLRKRKLWW